MLLALILVLCIQAALGAPNLDLSQGCDNTLPSADQCGGYGNCTQTQRCVCDKMWSTNSDFVIFEDCATSLVAMYVLWAINIIEICYVLYVTTYIIVARFENFFHQRKTKRDYTLWNNKGLIAVIIYFGLCMPAHLAMALLHMAEPLTRIGFDVIPTILFFLSKCGLYCTSVLVQGPLISAALKGRKEFRGLIRVNYIMSIVVSTISIVIGSMGFVTLDYFQTDRAKQVEIMRAYYYVQAIALFVNGLQAYFVKMYVFKVLDNARLAMSSSDKTEYIKGKIGGFQNQIFKQGCIQGVVYFVMAAVPFFINKHQYFLPMSWLAMPVLGLKLAFQFDTDKDGARSIRERLGLKKTGGSTLHSESQMKAGSTMKVTGRAGDKSNQSFNPENATNANGSILTVVEPYVASEIHETSNKKNKNRAGNQILSVAFSDEEGAMEEILKDETGELRDRFTEFIRSKYATESMVLYDACVRFQAASNSGAENLNKLGREIVKAHVADDAPSSVDMPDNMRKKLLAMYSQNDFPPTAMNQTKNMTFDLLKANFYQKFVKTLQDA